ncbi:MAG: hypothetical protein M1834_001319 [Cirrosporium novae-zelandiae]|nr:MAG: hypothetical protein M1834_001319 [Cirrosporium novae-zelandiae]
MAPQLKLRDFFLASLLLCSSSAAPLSSNINGPPSATGSLYGSEALLGDDGAGIDTADSAIVSNYDEAPGQKDDADLGLYLDFTKLSNPQPLRGSKGATDPGPRNYRYDAINSDALAPPGTDNGDVPQAKWPLGLSHNRLGLQGAGWARQQNEAVLPIATDMAGVDMRLAPHAYRELHWHKANEWSLMLNGSVRIQAMNENGETFVDDLNAGDVWFFPSGVPHSIQAFDEGCEFLLVFDDGSFSEEGTFLASELIQRNPKEVIAKNLQTDVSALDDIPDGQLYIFNGTPAPHNISAQNVTGPAGYLPVSDSYSYHFSQQDPYTVDAGTVKIIDPTTFPIASKFSAALVTVKPGAMREIHWHPTSDEWNFFISGSGRVTAFDAPEASRTFDFQAGDVGYIPVPQSHYVENVGTEDLVFLEVLQSDKFTDISMNQWLSLTPPQIIEDTLHLPAKVVAAIPKWKQYIVPGSVDLTETNFTAATST